MSNPWNAANEGELISSSGEARLMKHLSKTGKNTTFSPANVPIISNSSLFLLKKKEISEDEARGQEDKIQKLTDKFIAEVDQLGIIEAIEVQ